MDEELAALAKQACCAALFGVIAAFLFCVIVVMVIA